MKVETLSERWSDDYESFLLGRPDTLFYHSSRYQRMLVELLACRQETRIVLDDLGRITAAMPLMAMDGPFGTILNSLPFYGSNGGLVGEDASAQDALRLAYRELASGPGVAAATFIENPLSLTGPAGLPHDLVDERIGQLTPLPTGDDPAALLMAMFHQKTRNMVRKAEKVGVVVEIDNDAMAFVVETHEENMREIGGTPKSRRFFDLVPRCFRPGTDYDVYAARIGTTLVAALLVFYFNRTVEYFTPVVKAQFRDTQALSGIIFRALTDAARAGYLWWNWGGTWLSQDGVHRFKSRWGTQDILYHYYTAVRNAELLNAKPAELLSAYPNFFTVPFSALARSGGFGPGGREDEL